MPFFPFNQLASVIDIDYILSLETFKEAIYIASPDLYQEVYEKDNRSERVRMSIVKYFIRACSRCTPYGEFAGCNIISTGDTSHISVLSEQHYKTYLRIDMNFLCALIRELDEDPILRGKLKYHLNTSLYSIKNSVRYVNYTTLGNRRKYSFSEIKRSEYLDIIINKSKQKPQTISELANHIVSADISFLEAAEFINDLIFEQVLVSELEPSVIGSDLLFQIQDKLAKHQYNNPLITDTILAIKKCDNIPIGNRMHYYKEIETQFSKFKSTTSANLFHVDLKIPTENAYVGKEILDTVIKGINALCRLSTTKESEVINLFKKKYYEKYEEQEIPLAIALDTQIGIGIGPWNELRGDINTLIDDIIIPKYNEEPQPTALDFLTKLLISKYENYLKQGLDSINIVESDLMNISDSDLEYLPDQMYTTIKVLHTEENSNMPIIYMNSVSGGSAANLLSRFEYLDEKIQDFVNEITQTQAKYYPNQIIAEVLHLPEDRVGNIQMHPQNRPFGIPYLSNPHYLTSKIEIIPIDDIMVSVPQGKQIFLRSKKFNKEIIPRLTTAHNFSRGLPIYYFLCYLQHQNQKSLFFDWGEYFLSRKFLPRVIYENIILSPAKWKILLSDLPQQDVKFEADYLNQVNSWRIENKLPDMVQIVEGDNKLLIDFRIPLLIEVFLNYIKTKHIAFLEEFLFEEKRKHLCTRGDDFFTNELILCLHKNR